MGRQLHFHPRPTPVYYLWMDKSGTVQPHPENVITQLLFQEEIEFDEFPISCLTWVSCSHPYNSIYLLFACNDATGCGAMQ